MEEFLPPMELAVTFDALSQAIGASAYRSWFCGAQVWIDVSESIQIKALSQAKADWIRRNYAGMLEKIAACPVIVQDVRSGGVKHWPHNGPSALDVEAGGAWWQNNEWSHRNG